MKTPAQWLRTIERLRAKHTEAFKAEKWVVLMGITTRIKAAWEGYHRAVERQEQEKRNK